MSPPPKGRCVVQSAPNIRRRQPPSAAEQDVIGVGPVPLEATARVGRHFAKIDLAGHVAEVNPQEVEVPGYALGSRHHFGQFGWSRYGVTSWMEILSLHRLPCGRIDVTAVVTEPIHIDLDYLGPSTHDKDLVVERRTARFELLLHQQQWTGL